MSVLSCRAAKGARNGEGWEKAKELHVLDDNTRAGGQREAAQ